MERVDLEKKLNNGEILMGNNRHQIQISDTTLYKYHKNPNREPDHFGPIAGIPIGEMFISRMEACYAGIHRTTVAGISGRFGAGGAFSVCLSGRGQYTEDLDFGNLFIYSGAGGRDLVGTINNPKNLRCAPQSKDQELTRSNLALSMNVYSGNPVRVIRGFNLNSEFAPKWGYRYDGLYQVKEWRWVRASSGFKVITFTFKRIVDQESSPW